MLNQFCLFPSYFLCSAFPLLEPSAGHGFPSKSHLALSDGDNDGIHSRQLQHVTDCEYDV